MEVKNIILSSFILIVLDILWLYFFMGNQYSPMIKKIQGSNIKVKWYYAVGAYLLMIFALYYFVLRDINNDTKNKMRKALINGALLGLIIYGIYNFTAAAVISNWSHHIILFDILWGTFVFSISAFIGTLI